MTRLGGFARACHPLPAMAVAAVVTAFGWSLGWRGWPLWWVLVVVLVGQLSVGWGNDAHDAGLDAHVGRFDKPTVEGVVSPRALWIAAVTALAVSSTLSWVVAGLIGGSFHVLSLGMAWLYNLGLSRTVWSWIPYAVAFGAVPPFLSYGLSGEGPPMWSVAVFAIVGVSAHLANALPDVESDRAAGVDGLAVRLGTHRSSIVCWVLLGVGTVILVIATIGDRPLVSAGAAMTYVVEIIVGSRSRRRSAVFHALLAVVAVDVVALVLAVGS